MRPPENLTEAEERLCTAVRNGEGMDCTVGDPERDNAANGAAWGLERTLRAEVVRALCIGAWPDVTIDPRGVRISGARVVGALDLEAATLAFPLRLQGCHLEDELNLFGATIKLLDLGRAYAAGGIFAESLDVSSDLRLTKGFAARGEIRLVNAKIGGNLLCCSRLENPGRIALNADNADIGGSMFLVEDSTIRGEVRLVAARIGGNLSCGRHNCATRGEVRLENPGGFALIADNADIGGSVFLIRGFVARGEVRLHGARISTQLTCAGGSFCNPGAVALDVEAASIAGDVSLCADFAAQGTVASFAAKGTVNLLRAKIGGSLTCRGGSFENPGGFALIAEGVQVNGPLLWDKVTGRGSISFHHARVGQLVDDVKSWPARGRLLLDGFEYEALAEEAPVAAKARCDWLARQHEFRPQPYEHLVRVLRRMGHEDDAREVAIAKQRALRQEALRKRGWRALGAWIRSKLLELTVAHGYKPGRALWLALLVIAAGWAVFLAADWAGIMVPAKGEAYAGTPLPAVGRWPVRLDYPPFVAPLYSLDVFLPVVDLHQEQYWLPDRSQPLGLACWAWLWFHILAGWTLTTVLVAALTGLIKRD